VLLHSDFHLGNLVMTAPLGRLAGVWDFSCVATGHPSLDFRYLTSHRELAARVASAYAARTGREIDLGLAAAALTLEDVSDALEEGRDPAPYLR
jgi:aminoglycoside phosphotransferase (APT) family kinase protein